jgi:tRNA splicing endonuclease
MHRIISQSDSKREVLTSIPSVGGKTEGGGRSISNCPSSFTKNYDAFDRAEYSLKQGVKMAGKFGTSANLSGDYKSLAIADCLNETYKPENIFVGLQMTNSQTEERFDGYGVLQNIVACRLSQAYQKSASARARKKIEKRIKEYKLQKKEKYRFATFTMPFLRADVATVFAIASRAMELLKKRKVWKENVSGAFLGEETTVGDGSTFFFTHYHNHFHSLMVGKYVAQWQIADAWTSCVEKACREFRVEFLMTNLKTNRLVVDIRKVRKKEKNKRKYSISESDAITEVCKYTTTGSDYDKVPVQDLVDIERALRSRQMIKSYGVFNDRKGRENKSEEQKSEENKCVATSLDKQHTIDGDPDKVSKHKFKRNERKVPSLVNLGAQMIENGRRDDWLMVLRLTAENRRKYRRDYLSKKFPNALFLTLDGNYWMRDSPGSLVSH